jgi:hypothetical protein
MMSAHKQAVYPDDAAQTVIGMYKKPAFDEFDALFP